MKYAYLILFIFFCGHIFSQDNYVQFETVILTPDLSKIEELRENMRAHNAKYHVDLPFRTGVWQIVTGPNTGKIVWVMGPCTFAQLDERPSDDGHEEDWRKNISPLLKNTEHAEYWRQMPETVVNPADADDTTSPLLYLRYYSVNPGQGFSVDRLFGQLVEAVRQTEMTDSWSIYVNRFVQGVKNGRHYVSVRAMEKWADLDEDINFASVFNKIHGQEAHRTWVTETRQVFSNQWEEIWTFDAYMSGASMEQE